jgi:hypothetical protein
MTRAKYLRLRGKSSENQIDNRRVKAYIARDFRTSIKLMSVFMKKKQAEVKFDAGRTTIAAVENEISKLGFSTANVAAQTLAPGQKKCEAEKSSGMDCCAPPAKGWDT